MPLAETDRPGKKQIQLTYVCGVSIRHPKWNEEGKVCIQTSSGWGPDWMFRTLEGWRGQSIRRNPTAALAASHGMANFDSRCLQSFEKLALPCCHTAWKAGQVKDRRCIYLPTSSHNREVTFSAPDTVATILK